MNALRLRPVFIQETIAKRLDYQFGRGPHSFFSIEELTTEKLEVSGLVDKLVEEKVISVSTAIDSAVDNIRRIIPKPYIAVMYVLLSDECNLDCSYCFINQNIEASKGSRTGSMSVKTFQKALDFYARLIKLDPSRFDEEKTIIFYGGEPLVNSECLLGALELINQYRNDGRLSKNQKVSMVSNGTLLTPSIIDALKRHNVLFSISIDGGSVELNKCRKYRNGEPAFSDILKSIGDLKEQGVKFGLSVTISEEHLEHSDELLDSLVELGVPQIGFNPIVPSPGYPVSDKYAEQMAGFIIKAYERLGPAGISEDRIGRKLAAFSKAQLYYWDCAAGGGNQIVVAPDGKVGICHGLLGSREDFCTDVDDQKFDPASNDIYLKWNLVSPLNKTECESCFAVGICGGGCPIRGGTAASVCHAIDRQFCPHAKKTLEFMIWKLWEGLKPKCSLLAV